MGFIEVGMKMKMVKRSKWFWIYVFLFSNISLGLGGWDLHSFSQCMHEEHFRVLMSRNLKRDSH